jgi:hypothetical protein
MDRLFATNTQFDLMSGNVTQALRDNQDIEPRIKMILQSNRLVHPLDFFDIDRNMNEEEIIEDLESIEDLDGYLQESYRADFIRQKITNEITRRSISIEESVKEESLINLKTAIIDMASAFIYEYSRSNELAGDLRNRSSQNRRQFEKYHRKTIPINDVKGVNDKILDLQNYEQHRIMDILNNNNKIRRVTIFDKKLDEIIDEMINFFVYLPEKYDKYYKTLENIDSIFTKHLTSIVLVILDENNTIYIGLYLLIISIILYSINIIRGNE